MQDYNKADMFVIDIFLLGVGYKIQGLTLELF